MATLKEHKAKKKAKAAKQVAIWADLFRVDSMAPRAVLLLEKALLKLPLHHLEQLNVAFRTADTEASEERATLRRKLRQHRDCPLCAHDDRCGCLDDEA
jgi:hypothetical protein